jgi:DNA-binding response OmpR family regulator
MRRRRALKLTRSCPLPEQGNIGMRTHKILIADDSHIEAERIRRSLDALAGADVTVVDDGVAAIQATKNVRFDLVLCDYEMPGLNGLQVVRLLRSSWSRLQLPILMLTVRDDVQTKVLSLRQGANDYVTKPIQPEELLARVQGQLDLKMAVEENIKARMRIVEARKHETIGRLAAGLAHELNTPAQFTADNLVFLQKVLDGAAELLLRTREHAASLPDAQAPWADEFLDFWKQKQLSYLLLEAPKALEESLSGVMRMARIVRDLKEFAGMPDQPWGLADLNRALENTVAVSRQIWSSVAQISFKLAPQLPQIACDVAALKQAFFNILVATVENAPPELLDSSTPLQIEICSTRTADGVEIRFQSDRLLIQPSFTPPMLGAFLASEPPGVSGPQGLAVAHSVIVDQHRGQLSSELHSDGGGVMIIRLREGQACPSPPSPLAQISL